MGFFDYFKRKPRIAPYLPAEHPNYRVRGNRGTVLSGGRISGIELNPEVIGVNWITECQSMLRTDPMVAVSWRLIKQTLLSADWEWIPGDEADPVSRQVADYANQAFGFAGYPGEMSVSWEAQLDYLLEYIPYGYRYAEELYRYGHGEDGGRVWLERYADRIPAAHLKWLSRDGQTLDGVQQRLTGTAEPPDPIPANKLLLLTHGREGANFEGCGLLRPAYWHYRSKQRISNLLQIGVERWAVPTPVVKVNREAAEAGGYNQEQVEALIDQAESQALAYVSAESSYLVEPSAVVSFESYGASGELNVGGVEAAIAMCDTQIATSMMTQMINLGVTDTGSRSVGEVHANLFRRSCVNLLDTVSNAVSGPDRAGGGTIGRLARFNFGAHIRPAQLPRLVHTGLDSDQLAESLINLPALVTGGLLTPDDELESAIRQRIGVTSELTEENQRSALERTSAGMGAGAAPTALAEQYIRLRRGLKHASTK